MTVTSELGGGGGGGRRLTDRQECRQADRNASRQADKDRQAGRQAGRQRQTGRQAGRQRQTGRQAKTDRKAGRQAGKDRQTGRQTDRQRQTDRKADRQTDRQADRRKKRVGRFAGCVLVCVRVTAWWPDCRGRWCCASSLWPGDGATHKLDGASTWYVEGRGFDGGGGKGLGRGGIKYDEVGRDTDMDIYFIVKATEPETKPGGGEVCGGGGGGGCYRWHNSPGKSREPKLAADRS